MARTHLSLCLLAIVGVLAVALKGLAGPEDDPIARQFAALTERIKRIEVSIGIQDGQTLAPPIAHRLESTEDKVHELERRFEDAGTGLPERQLEDLQRQIKQALADAKDLETQLLAMQNDRLRLDQWDRDIRALNSAMQTMQTTISNIQQRLTKLENK